MLPKSVLQLFSYLVQAMLIPEFAKGMWSLKFKFIPTSWRKIPIIVHTSTKRLF